MKRTATLMLALGIAAVAACASVEASAQPRERGQHPVAHGASEPLHRFARDLPPQQRRAAVRRLRGMDAERRARFRQAVRHWDQLTPQQRERVRERVQRLRRFSEEQRERIERNRPAWEKMDPADRERMRRRLELFRSLPPAEQEALVGERFPDRTPEQRARILDRLRAR